MKLFQLSGMAFGKLHHQIGRSVGDKPDIFFVEIGGGQVGKGRKVPGVIMLRGNKGNDPAGFGSLFGKQCVFKQEEQEKTNDPGNHEDPKNNAKDLIRLIHRKHGRYLLSKNI